ncbi:MAG: HD domain-containing protein, partial [Candidatus Lokiarchaeota archaeon]|nr:HD domain-containing protein [Candidatus Lokiarchaeota archaeon]
IWDDFFEQKSEEARLVFQIDKLEMAIQALEYGGKNNSKIYSEFFLSVEKNILDPKLKEIYNSLKS